MVRWYVMAGVCSRAQLLISWWPGSRERERERERERGIEMENGLLFVYPLQRYT
jgi:hypothetical protein